MIVLERPHLLETTARESTPTRVHRQGKVIRLFTIIYRMAPCRMVLAYRLVLTAIALSNGLEPTTGGSAHSDRWTRGQALPTATEAEECRGWLNGTLGTYNKPEMTNHKIRAHKGGFTSQHRQDKILYKHLFRNLSRTGIYADVAANHWKSLSNSYFLTDACTGTAFASSPTRSTRPAC